jgi:hypothetical protein
MLRCIPVRLRDINPNRISPAGVKVLTGTQFSLQHGKEDRNLV